MLNYTFNTSAPLWTFLRVWGQAFPVSVNDPTSGELSCCPPSLAGPPSIIHSLRLLTPPPLKKKKTTTTTTNPRPPPFTNASDSLGLNPCDSPGLSSPKHRQTGKDMHTPTASRTCLREHTCKVMRACKSAHANLAPPPKKRLHYISDSFKVWWCNFIGKSPTSSLAAEIGWAGFFSFFRILT